MTKYIFDTYVAKKVGVNAAVIYENLCYWIDKNKANNKNFKEDKYWTYNSIKAFEKLFPFMSARQIRTALDKLITAKLVEVGNFNNKSYDRTNWYAVSPINNHLSEKSNASDKNKHIHLSEKSTGVVTNDEPIPDTKPNGNNNLFGDSLKDPLKEEHFRDSVFGCENGKSLYLSNFNQEKEIGIDVEYYFNSVEDWSETKTKNEFKRTAKGWIATARQFMRRDKNEKKLKMLMTEQSNSSDRDALKYLTQNYD